MRSGPFALLVLAWCIALLGLRWAAEPLAAGIAHLTAQADEDARERSIALPPKPEGLVPPAVPTSSGPGAGAARLTRDGCLARPASLHDVCLQALARQGAAADPTGSAERCQEVRDPELREECLADVAEAAAPTDRAASERICAQVTLRKWRGQCHFGIGLALAETAPDYALGRCEHAEAFRDFCRHDVVGEVALANLASAVAFCAREEGDALTRKTCWHGIGKYLARRDAAEAASACAQATESWRGNCVHGLGWGAAERDPDAALAACANLGAYTENCRQGVAHQLKRFDAPRALALCETLRDSRLRARCLAFVKR